MCCYSVSSGHICPCPTIFRSVWSFQVKSSSPSENVFFCSNTKEIHTKVPPFGLQGSSSAGFIGFNLTHGIARPPHPGLVCRAWLFANPCSNHFCSGERAARRWCLRSTFNIEMDYERVSIRGLKPNVDCYQPLWGRQAWRKEHFDPSISPLPSKPSFLLQEDTGPFAATVAASGNIEATESSTTACRALTLLMTEQP